MFFGGAFGGGSSSSSDGANIPECKLLCAARSGEFIWTCVRYQTPSRSANEEQISVRCSCRRTSESSSADGECAGSYDFLSNSDVDRRTPICDKYVVPTPFVTSALFIDHRSAAGLGSGRRGAHDISLVLGTSTGHVRFLNFCAVVDSDTANVFVKSSFAYVFHPVSVEAICAARDMSVFTQLFVLYGDSRVAQLELDVSGGISSYSATAVPRTKHWQVPFCAKAITPLPAPPLFPTVVPPDASTASSERVDMLVGGKNPVLAVVSSQSGGGGGYGNGSADRSQSVPLSLGKAFLSVAGWLLSSAQESQQQQQTQQQQQQQQQVNGNALQRLNVLVEINDPPREVLSFSPSPSYQYVAAADTLGRVSIVDTAAACLIVRIFKGYRNAQCAWLNKGSLPESIGCKGTGEEEKEGLGESEEEGDELRRMVLAIYTPVQSIVDLWEPLAQSPFRRIEVDPKYKIAPLYCGNIADNLIFFDASNGTATPLHEFVLSN